MVVCIRERMLRRPECSENVTELYINIIIQSSIIFSSCQPWAQPMRVLSIYYANFNWCPEALCDTYWQTYLNGIKQWLETIFCTNIAETKRDLDRLCRVHKQRELTSAWKIIANGNSHLAYGYLAYTVHKLHQMYIFVCSRKKYTFGGVCTSLMRLRTVVRSVRRQANGHLNKSMYV